MMCSAASLAQRPEMGGEQCSSYPCLSHLLLATFDTAIIESGADVIGASADVMSS